MYAGQRSLSGMGFEWGPVITTGENILARIFGHGSTPVTTLPTGYGGGYQQPQGIDLTTLGLVGIGIFFLVKAFK